MSILVLAFSACGGNGPTPLPPAPTPAGTFTLTCSPTSIEAGWDGASEQSCAVTSLDGFSERVALACAGIPAGASCEFQPTTVTPDPNGTIKANLSVTYTDIVPAGTSRFQVVGTSGTGASKSSTITLTKNVETVTRDCPSRSDVATVDADFRLTWEADPTAGGAGGCPAAKSGRPLTALQANVYRSLATMRRLTFSQPLPWTPDPVYVWFKRSIRGIRFRSDIAPLAASCCDPADTISINVGGVSSWTSSSPVGTSLGNLSLLVHEARHNNGNITHNCGAKDQSVTELRAFGAQYYFLMWLATRLDSAFITPTVADSLRSFASTICSQQTCSGTCPL